MEMGSIGSGSTLRTCSTQEQAEQKNYQHDRRNNYVASISFEGKGDNGCGDPYNRCSNQEQKSQRNNSLWTQHKQTCDNLAESVWKSKHALRRQASRSCWQ